LAKKPNALTFPEKLLYFKLVGFGIYNSGFTVSFYLVEGVAMFVPTRMFFTKGVGRHKDYLQSFELALRNAGIEKCNIVMVSSIYPPGCKRIPKEEGLKLLHPGAITFAVMARNSTNEPNRLIAASLGVAQPADENMYGYLSEHHPYGETDEKPAITPRIWLPPCWRRRWTGVRSEHRVGRTRKALQNVRQNRSHLQHHPIRRRRQTRLMDDGDCVGGAFALII
jgi:pyruvoyl-dependent arginine decarboxylase